MSDLLPVASLLVWVFRFVLVAAALSVLALAALMAFGRTCVDGGPNERLLSQVTTLAGLIVLFSVGGSLGLWLLS